MRLKIGDFHSIMCFICYQWAPFSVCSISKKLLCKKYHNKKKDVCHKTKQMIAMKKKGSRLIVYGVFFLFLPFFLYLMLNVECILLGKCFFSFLLCIFGDGKLIDEFSSGNFFRNSNKWWIFLIIIRLQFVFVFVLSIQDYSIDFPQ